MGQLYGRRSSTPSGHGQHACWGYSDEEMFWRYVDEFVQEGVDKGDRVLTLTAGRPGVLRSGGRRSRVTEVAVEDFDVDVTGGAANRWRTMLRTMAEKALSDGYTGVRVLADTTPLANAVTRERLSRWELNLGSVVTEYPMTVVCAIQPGEVDKNVAADLASLHTAVDGTVPTPLASIRLTRDTVFVRGELDSTNSHLLELALAEVAGDVTVDLNDVTFIDVGSIDHLRRFVAEAEQQGRSVTLTGVPEVVERCWALLGGLR